jgi:hypothetical protein
MKTARWIAIIIVATAVAAGGQSIEVPYRGLDYSMLSKGGVTVMIAPLDLTILHYAAAHVWITNGSSRTILVSPQAFVARARTPKQAQPAEFPGSADNKVVNDVMEHARFNDVLALVRAYERNLYGFKNPTAINYYQARKQVAAAEGSSRRFRAGAMVSALVLPKTQVPPGEFREGTVFFPVNDKKAQFTEFSVELGGLSFVFRPPQGSE